MNKKSTSSFSEFLLNYGWLLLSFIVILLIFGYFYFICDESPPFTIYKEECSSEVITREAVIYQNLSNGTIRILGKFKSELDMININYGFLEEKCEKKEVNEIEYFSNSHVKNISRENLTEEWIIENCEKFECDLTYEVTKEGKPMCKNMINSLYTSYTPKPYDYKCGDNYYIKERREDISC